MKCILVIACFAVALCACSHRVVTSIQSNRVITAPDAEVVVIDIDQQVPESAELLGTVKLGDTGFSANCGYEAAMSILDSKARAAGGNVIRITDYTPPSAFGSTCHRFTAQILFVQDLKTVVTNYVSEEQVDSALLAEGCCMVHIYRFGGLGALISYDLKVNDEVVTRVSNNSKMSAKMIAAGPTTFRAATETREEVNIDLQPGRHYYIRCGLVMGVMVGRPSLAVVGVNSGKREFDALNAK